jgi:hypothetical protein
VYHYFKVGQLSSQGKAMICNLAYQLAVKIPAYGETLRKVITQHGNGSALTLEDMLEKYEPQHPHLFESMQIIIQFTLFTQICIMYSMMQISPRSSVQTIT